MIHDDTTTIRGERGNYGHRFLNLCIFASSSSTLKLTWWQMRMRHPLNMIWINTENDIQSLSYLWKKILESVRYSPTSSGEYRTSDGVNADKKRSRLKGPTYNEVLTFQAG